MYYQEASSCLGLKTGQTLSSRSNASDLRDVLLPMILEKRLTILNVYHPIPKLGPLIQKVVLVQLLGTTLRL